MRRYRSMAAVLAAVAILFVGTASAIAAPDPADAEPVIEVGAPEEEYRFTLADDISVDPESGLFVEAEEEEGTELLWIRGLVAAPAAQAERAGDFLAKFLVPEGAYSGCVCRGDIRLEDAEIVATGDEVVFVVSDDETAEVCRATIIVDGDVIGSGIMSLAQLVRMAAAINNPDAPLEGPYFMAADFDGGGTLSLSDLVIESEMLAQTMKAARS